MEETADPLGPAQNLWRKLLTAINAAKIKDIDVDRHRSQTKLQGTVRAVHHKPEEFDEDIMGHIHRLLLLRLPHIGPARLFDPLQATYGY